MSTTEAIMQKVNALPPEKQEQVLRYAESLAEMPTAKSSKPHEWLEIALNARLQGPPDWSEHLDDYLYGDKKNAL